MALALAVDLSGGAMRLAPIERDYRRLVPVLQRSPTILSRRAVAGVFGDSTAARVRGGITWEPHCGTVCKLLAAAGYSVLSDDCTAAETLPIASHLNDATDARPDVAEDSTTSNRPLQCVERAEFTNWA